MNASYSSADLSIAHVSRLHPRKPRHDTLYIGVTNSLQERLEQHRNGKGYSFVKAHGVFRLAYVESYDRVEEAITREKQLKRWKRGWKIELTERENLFARVGSFSKADAGGYGSLLSQGRR